MAMAKKPASNAKKKPIDQYAHKGKQRANNPPVGLVTVATDDCWDFLSLNHKSLNSLTSTLRSRNH